MKVCIEEMRKLFMQNQQSEFEVPLRNKMQLLDGNILGLMPAYILPYQIMGIKVLPVSPKNYKKGLSSHQGIIPLFDLRTGEFFVDNYEAASKEAGDIIILANEDNCDISELICSDLHDLLAARPEQFKTTQTIFKSVGIATEDLAVVWFCYKKTYKNDSFCIDSCSIQPKLSDYEN